MTRNRMHGNVLLHVRVLEDATEVWRLSSLVSQSPCTVEYPATRPRLYDSKMLALGF